jgi:hypothetical protein
LPRARRGLTIAKEYFDEVLDEENPMAAKKILMLVGDYVEDYEVMVVGGT